RARHPPGCPQTLEHSLPGRAHPLASNSLRHLQNPRGHPIPQDGRVSGGRYLKVVRRTSAALTNSVARRRLGVQPESAAKAAFRTAVADSAGAATITTRCEDPFVQLAIFESQGDLLLEGTLVDEPVQEFVVHHLLDVRDRGL